MKTRETISQCAVALVLVAGCGKHEDEPTVAARPVRAHRVAERPANGGLRYSASLQPHQEVPIAFKASGYVSTIEQRRSPDGRTRNLQQGDLVRRGTVLAKLRDADMLEQVQQARAQRDEGDAALVKAKLDLDRAERLYKSQSLTRPDYDAAVAASAGAQARYDAAAAKLRAAEIALQDCTITSPIDGVVLSRKVEVGTLAGPGTVAFVLADVSRLSAVFGVPARQIASLALGDSLPISIEGRAPFPAQITALSPSADSQSRVFSVEVAVPNPQRELRTGMIATVLVPNANSERQAGSAVVIPITAVVRPRSGDLHSGYAVFVIDGSDSSAVARERTVQLGPIAGNNVEVQSGLQPGERVVATGATLVQDGDAVRILQ